MVTITNADAATQMLAQTTLMNVLGTKNLAEILSDREEIAHSLQCTLDEARDVATKKNSPVVFPLPVDLMHGFRK